VLYEDQAVERSAHNVTDALIGRVIEGKYRIDSKLGAGGMGAVYCATRLVIGDEIAIKILHAEQSDPKATERFRREAQAAARLKHPNAVVIHDFGVTDDGLQYLVMELVEGESLRQIIDRQGPLTPSASAEIVDQVCAALDEAHRHHIIHRDIKPDNIIVNVSATGLRVKVLDFGIAKLRDDATGNLTQTGNILGTPHYMSPEQCLGEELDSLADIYSLGIVLFEMLAGVVPFNSPVSTAVVVQHVNQAPPSLRTLNASISPAVESVVMQALEKRREARPQTAAELAQSFSSSVSGASTGTSQAVPRSYAGTKAQTQPTVVSRPFSSGAFSTPANQAIPESRNRGRFGYVAVGMSALVLGGIIMLIIKSGGEKLNSAQTVNAAPVPNLRQSQEVPAQNTPSLSSNLVENRDNQTRFSVSSCSSVKDLHTGLEWFVGPDRNMTWPEARQWTVGLQNCGGDWRMPTTEEIKGLYDPAAQAGIGYYTGGKYFPAHIDPAFNAIGGGSWVWADETTGNDARSFNLNQGKAVIYPAMNTLYSTRAFAVRNTRN
jgi:serine/threonine-protein kinase